MAEYGKSAGVDTLARFPVVVVGFTFPGDISGDIDCYSLATGTHARRLFSAPQGRAHDIAGSSKNMEYRFEDWEESVGGGFSDRWNIDVGATWTGGSDCINGVGLDGFSRKRALVALAGFPQVGVSVDQLDSG